MKSLFWLLVASCLVSTFTLRAQGVLFLTFDDKHWDKWIAAQPLLAKYDAHVSFFPYGYLDDAALKTLKTLQDAGHTIGIHTLHHKNAAPFFKEYGAEAYWRDEVLPQKKRLEAVGIRADTFAYPCSDRNDETDRFLLAQGMTYLRSGKGGDLSVSFPVKELASQRVLTGFGIGTYYKTDIKKVCALIRRIAAEDRAVVIYSHDIAAEPSKIGMRLEWLEAILKTAKDCGVAMKGMGELDSPRYSVEKCYGGVLDVGAAGVLVRPNERIGTKNNFREGGADLVASVDGTESVNCGWTFPYKQEVTFHYLSFELNAAIYAGGEAEACGRRVKLPESLGGVHLLTGEGRSFAFSDKAGRERMRLDFAEDVALHAMDARSWKKSHIVFRFAKAAKGGEAVGFTCKLTFPEAEVTVKDRPDYTITAAEDWIPLKSSAEIVAGSALDFSEILSVHAPIAEGDRIVVRNGRFEALGQKGAPIRLVGCNVTAGANFMNKQTADRFVTRLRRLGYNALRLHHQDDGLDKDIAAADALVAACAEQGLYLTSDLFVSRKIPWRDIGENRDGVIGQDEFKRLVLTHEGAFSNYCAFAHRWLTHVNKYTKRRLADEPALALLAFVNEGHLETKGEAAKADAELEMKFSARVADFLRNEIGTKALLSDMSAGMEDEAFRVVRESDAYDYVDEHYYCDHPNFPETPWKLPARVLGENPLRTWSGIGFQRKLANVRVKGKPFVMTEWDWTGGFGYRSAAGLVVGSVASADAWNGLWRFNFANSVWEAMHSEQCGIGFFSIAGNPHTQAGERAVMTLFGRGDLLSEDSFVADKAKGSFMVDTPRTAGGFVESGEIRTSTLVARISGGSAAVWATSLDARPIAESRRILLSHLTDIQNTGETYADESRCLLKKWGKVPHLMRTGKAKVALRVGPGEYEAWALAADGTRLAKIPMSRTENGRLAITLDVGRDRHSATWLYEVSAKVD